MEKKIEIESVDAPVKSYVFDGHIELEEVTKLIEAIDEGAREIYFCSEGGNIAFVPVILDMFNKHDIILKAYDGIVSAAFTIYAKYQGRKTLLEETFGGIHLPTSELDWRSSFDKGRTPGFYKNMYLMRHDSLEVTGNSYINELISYGVPMESIEKVKAGEDVYISYEEMLKLDFGGKNG